MSFDISTDFAPTTLIFFIAFTLGGQLWVEWFKHQLELSHTDPDKAVDSQKRLFIAAQKIATIIFRLIFFAVGIWTIYLGVQGFLKADLLLGTSYVLVGLYPFFYLISIFQKDDLIASTGGVFIWIGFAVMGMSLLLNGTIVEGIILAGTSIFATKKRINRIFATNTPEQDNQKENDVGLEIKKIFMIVVMILFLLGVNWVYENAARLPSQAAWIIISICFFIVGFFHLISSKTNPDTYHSFIVIINGAIALPLLLGTRIFSDFNFLGITIYIEDITTVIKVFAFYPLLLSFTSIIGNMFFLEKSNTIPHKAAKQSAKRKSIKKNT